MKKLFIGLCLFLSGQSFVFAEQVDVEIVEIGTLVTTDYTEVTFHVNGEVPRILKVFSLHSPDRLVIDIPRVMIMPSLLSQRLNRGVVRNIHARNKDHTLRITFDLKHSVKPQTFVRKPDGEYGHRLVVRLKRNEEETSSNLSALENTETHAEAHPINDTANMDADSTDHAMDYAVKIGMAGWIIGGWLFLIRIGFSFVKRAKKKHENL